MYCLCLRETCWDGSQVSLPLRQIARSKNLGPLVAVFQSFCSLLFRKISLSQQDLFSLFSHRCRLLLRSKRNSSRRRISSSCVIWKLARSILQRVFSVGNCACLCHFSYAHATCVNAVMLMLMSQRKPGLSNDNSYGNKKVTNLHI